MNNIPPDYTQNLISQLKSALGSCSWSIKWYFLPFHFTLLASYAVGMFLEEHKAIDKTSFKMTKKWKWIELKWITLLKKKKEQIKIHQSRQHTELPWFYSNEHPQSLSTRIDLFLVCPTVTHTSGAVGREKEMRFRIAKARRAALAKRKLTFQNIPTFRRTPA